MQSRVKHFFLQNVS